MTDQPGYEAIEYEDGIEPPKLRFVISQKRMTIGELVNADNLTAAESLEFVARFLVNDNGLFATRCMRKRDGSLQFFGIDEATKIIINMMPGDYRDVVNQVTASVSSITKSAVPLATGDA
jgi:hypothetical protein